jgi:hypothetical protein
VSCVIEKIWNNYKCEKHIKIMYILYIGG